MVGYILIGSVRPSFCPSNRQLVLLVKRTPLSPRLFIFVRRVAYGLQSTANVSYHQYYIGINGLVIEGHIILIICLTAFNANYSSFFGLRCSYLAQNYPTKCRLQQTFQITSMTLESKVNVAYTFELPYC